MSDTDDMKMTGLILAQSALVGIAVGVFASGLWLPAGSDGGLAEWYHLCHGSTSRTDDCLLPVQDVLRGADAGEGQGL